MASPNATENSTTVITTVYLTVNHTASANKLLSASAV
jgi:hypothetical protein